MFKIKKITIFITIAGITFANANEIKPIEINQMIKKPQVVQKINSGEFKEKRKEFHKKAIANHIKVKYLKELNKIKECILKLNQKKI